MSGVKRYLVTRGSEVSEMVYASDYDRDTQALKDELDNIKRSWGLILSQRDALAAERSWAETELPSCLELAEERRIERDELRVQVEVMRALLGECRDFTDTLQWPQRLRDKIDAALQEPKP